MRYTIDLHGLTREEAFMMVEDELLKYSNIGSFEVTIITGNSKPMRDGVISLCLTHGFTYTTLPQNLGQVIVSYVSI